VSTHHRQSNSSHLNENPQVESAASNKSQLLRPDDRVPDVGFKTFLRIIRDSFPDVVYTLQHSNYARFRFKNQHPDDPEPVIYAILAREGGTYVGYEQIYKLFDRFNLSIDKFKEALNELAKTSSPES
jgi:hypothetical protein